MHLFQVDQQDLHYLPQQLLIGDSLNSWNHPIVLMETCYFGEGEHYNTRLSLLKPVILKVQIPYSFILQIMLNDIIIILDLPVGVNLWRQLHLILSK